MQNMKGKGDNSMIMWDLKQKIIIIFASISLLKMKSQTIHLVFHLVNR